MRKLSAILLWLVLCLPALAQPIQCPDRPTADSSNACANTRFVHAVGGGGGGGGIINVGPSLLATAAVLPNTPTYSNGASGVGATLTAGSNTTLTVDGTAAPLTTIVLVKDQAAPAQNGIYSVTAAGSGGAPWVLTRVTYFDQAAEMLAGSYTYISGGATNINSAWTLQANVTTVGTTPANFVLFSTVSGLWTANGSDVYRPSGNVGIGAAPNTWGAPYLSVLQLSSIAIGRIAGDQASFVVNAYYDGANYKYINNGFANLYLFGSGGYDWLTASTGTAGNNVSFTERMHLDGGTGALTISGLTKGVVNSSASGVLSSKSGYTTSIIYAADYGVIADGVTNNNASLASAITACSTVRGTGNGCILQLPCGDIIVSAAININFGIIVQGCGKGFPATFQAMLGSGSIIRQTCSTCDTFDVVSIDPVQFRDMGFQASFAQTAGTFIYVKPIAVPLSNPNTGSVFSRIQTVGGFNVIKCELCGTYTISDNFFTNYNGTGITLTASATLSDSGESLLTGNAIVGASTASSIGVLIQTQSAVKFVGNKFILNAINLKIVADQGVTGTILISSNSFEEVGTNDIRIERALAGATHGLITIVGNEFQTNNTTSFQGNIVSVTPGAAFITKMIISSNIFINVSGGPLTSAVCVGLQAVTTAIINNNICDMSGTAGWGGIHVTTNSSDVSVLDNVVNGVGAGASDYVFTVSTTWRDLRPRTVANLPANAANGSQGFTSDGNSASPCGGGGTGSMAFRQNGAWKCF